jgi:hypothetical protein
MATDHAPYEPLKGRIYETALAGILERHANDAQRNRRPTGTEQDHEKSEYRIDREPHAPTMARRFALEQRGCGRRQNIDRWHHVQLDGRLFLFVNIRFSRPKTGRGNTSRHFLGLLGRVDTFLLIVRYQLRFLFEQPRNIARDAPLVPTYAPEAGLRIHRAPRSRAHQSPKGKAVRIQTETPPAPEVRCAAVYHRQRQVWTPFLTFSCQSGPNVSRVPSLGWWELKVA